MGDDRYREIPFADIAKEPDPFAAHGDCVLKVQRGAEVLGIRVKIMSVPQEVLDWLGKRQPKPPAKMVRDPKTRQTAFAPDEADPKYREELAAYNLALTREVVGRGLAETLTLRDGTLATTPEQKFAALEQRGLTGTHFAELMTAILNLTEWTETERETHL